MQVQTPEVSAKKATTPAADLRLVSVEQLQKIHRELDACQKVIWLAGCGQRGYGFDPSYVTGAQEQLQGIEALINAAAPVAQAGQVPEGMRLVPFNPTQDQWGGLARAIVFWMRSYPSNKHTPATLVEFITSLGHEVPEWMGDEVELRAQDHVISKGTVAVLIYKAMLATAPAQGGV